MVQEQGPLASKDIGGHMNHDTTTDWDRCIVCGARFKDGEGWLDPHKFPCANDRYGWLFTIKDSERDSRSIACID